LAGLAAALALIGCVVGERDKALVGELGGIESGCLFLDTARGMNDDDCHLAAIFREIFREVEIAGHLDRAVGKSDAFHFPLL